MSLESWILRLGLESCVFSLVLDVASQVLVSHILVIPEILKIPRVFKQTVAFSFLKHI
jgi:hypothetical protein